MFDSTSDSNQAICSCCRVDVLPDATPLGGNGFGFRIDCDCSHEGQVDDQPAVRRRGAGSGVTATADGEVEVMSLSELYSSCYLAG